MRVRRMSARGALRNWRAAAQFPESKGKLPTEAGAGTGEHDPLRKSGRVCFRATRGSARPMFSALTAQTESFER